ncbi:lipase domain-containing protein [Phthorimaea operculella]|nr:lipase domain-containing protein [Phthorimaea operculella]
MHNNTSATLMLQTIMVLMRNSTDMGILTSEDPEKCYGNYGCFSKAYPWTEHRPENYFPQEPDEMGVQYVVFTRRNLHNPVLLTAEDSEMIRNSNIDPRGPFYFIAHGFLEGGHKLWIEKLTNALLSVEGNDAATVFIVDWRGGSQPPYGQAVANIRLIGRMTAYLIHHVYEQLGLSNLNNFHFIGHSLGAHLAGYCGHALQRKFRLKLGRITGLDPAAPYFTDTVTLVRLDRTDATYVDIIHSNALPLYERGFGISEPIGHVDFYPNGGQIQPGCAKDTTPMQTNMYHSIQKMIGCNHERSYEFFTESIAPTCPFFGVRCESYAAFLSGNCTTCDDKYHFCLPMGYHSYRHYKGLHRLGLVDTNSNLALYSLTGPSKPYCRVHYNVQLKVSNATDAGRIAIILVDKHNNRTSEVYLDEEQKFYSPGEIEQKMLAFKDTGLPPQSVIAEWKYETHLFNPATWRLIKSSHIYIEYLKLTSLEYHTEITFCTKNKTPLLSDSPAILKTRYCKFK